MVRAFYRFNQVAGIAIHTHAAGNPELAACMVSVKGQQLHIDQQLSGFQALGELSKRLPGKSIVALNLSGKGILTKQMEQVAAITADNFNQLLPNARIEDFYVQHVMSGAFSFVSLIRKSEADKWFEQLQELGFYAVLLSLGPFAVSQVLGELNVYGEEVIFHGHVLKRNEQNEWLDYRYDQAAKAAFKLKIQNEGIEEGGLLAYAAAFQLILHDRIDLIKAVAVPFDELLNEKKTAKRLQVNFLVLLLAFFVLLVFNSLLSFWLQSSNAELQSRFSRSISNSHELKINRDQVKEKEDRLKAMGWDGGIGKSELIDQIAAVLPHDVQWTEVTINPVDNQGKPQEKSVLFLDRHIRVSGLSAKLLTVNEWLARIKTMPWVKRAELEYYTYSQELNTGVFTLNIIY